MNSIQQYSVARSELCPVGEESVVVVLYSDHVAAVEAGMTPEVVNTFVNAAKFKSRKQAIDDCIDAVEAVEGGYSVPPEMPVGAFIDSMRREFVAALRALKEQP